MAQIRDILKHVSVETALGKRKCARAKIEHRITKGTVHLAVIEEGYRNRTNYCLECALPMLELATRRLEELRTQLNSGR